MGAIGAVAPGAAGELFTELSSFTNFRDRIDGLLRDLKASPAGPGKVGEDTVGRSQFGGGEKGWTEAEALHASYSGVIKELEGLSQLLSDSIEGMSIAVLASHKGRPRLFSCNRWISPHRQHKPRLATGDERRWQDSGRRTPACDLDRQGKSGHRAGRPATRWGRHRRRPSYSAGFWSADGRPSSQRRDRQRGTSLRPCANRAWHGYGRHRGRPERHGWRSTSGG
ncbi:hypothetical protein [Streptomyces sp. NPDC018000]|uniref:hypothetical protein n=1 Tax=Streptomyces sp. NPDC018000 TaxID=3365028 RepID=UPI0037900E57